MNAKKYASDLFDIVQDCSVTNDQHVQLSYKDGIEKIYDKICDMMSGDSKMIFVGNGGSAAIASHCAIDYWKNGNIPAICFNEGALLTCISNDFGFEAVFEKPLEMFAKEGDLLVAISSSGQSKNILNAASMAKEKKVEVITFTGFDTKNPLKQMGILNFYVPSISYGQVELIHQIALHTVLDFIVMCKNDKEEW